ncbi:MAG: AraC family transcriptional regulator [Terrimicrobiaceae bacterium]
MRARYEKITPDPDRSFHVAEQRLARFDAPWHFHPEIELTWIVESRGRRFVGDGIAPFREGDLVLLGPDLPHLWQNEGTQERGSRAHSVMVQFSAGFLGREIYTCPEFQNIRRLIGSAARGLEFSREFSRAAADDLGALCKLSGLRALTRLLELLERLSSDRKAKPLTSPCYAPVLDRRKEARLARVYGYAARHFRERVTLAGLARAAAMSPAAFSRYFKRSTGRAPSDFLNDLRIEHTCRLLRETPRTVADIALEAGFSTLTNFSRRFRERTGTTPREYRGAFHQQDLY